MLTCGNYIESTTRKPLQEAYATPKLALALQLLQDGKVSSQALQEVEN
jgi:hypothetical protein